VAWCPPPTFFLSATNKSIPFFHSCVLLTSLFATETLIIEFVVSFFYLHRRTRTHTTNLQSRRKRKKRTCTQTPSLAVGGGGDDPTAPFLQNSTADRRQSFTTHPARPFFTPTVLHLQPSQQANPRDIEMRLALVPHPALPHPFLSAISTKRPLTQTRSAEERT
jgi:hypothetical protein